MMVESPRSRRSFLTKLVSLSILYQARRNGSTSASESRTPNQIVSVSVRIKQGSELPHRLEGLAPSAGWSRCGRYRPRPKFHNDTSAWSDRAGCGCSASYAEQHARSEPVHRRPEESVEEALNGAKSS